ncbi:MAG: endonuclease/exonuclease/phosphatase family protein [Pyrinomonadaceae bacterium]|nr:endonuclease/exonuclease/phosphatase family protein [Pyrinomonadaceae bacterium]
MRNGTITIIAYLLGTVSIAATALPLFRSEVWWVRIFDFPRLQVLFLGVVSLVLFFLSAAAESFGEALFSAALLLAIGHQAYMMFPYTRLAGKQVEDSVSIDPSRTIRILFANVLMTNRDAARIKRIIRKAAPDVLLLVETDQWWREQMDELMCDFPHPVQHPKDNTYGMLLYSKLELVDAVVKFLVHNDVPSIHGKLRLESGDEVEFRCLHPRPPVPNEEPSSGPRDAEILVVGKENREDDNPFIVFGDLNDVAWSRTNYLFQNVSGLLDPRVGRGFYHTFHARIPFLRFPLDHYFHSNHFRLVAFERLEYFGSDHFPVLIELSLEPDSVLVQENLTPQPEEVIEVEEKIFAARAESQLSDSHPQNEKAPL